MSAVLMILNPIKNVSMKKFDEKDNIYPFWSDCKYHDFISKVELDWKTKCSNRILSNIEKDYWISEKIFDEFPKELVMVFDKVACIETWKLRSKFLNKKYPFYLTSRKKDMMTWILKNVKYKNDSDAYNIFRKLEQLFKDGMIFYAGF